MDYYGDKTDWPPWVKALAEVRRMGPREGWRYHVQAIIVAIEPVCRERIGQSRFLSE